MSKLLKNAVARTLSHPWADFHTWFSEIVSYHTERTSFVWFDIQKLLFNVHTKVKGSVREKWKGV